MKIYTKYHGVREYEDKDILTFKKGLPGFEHLKKFIIFSAEENEVFSVLHSIEDENIGFVVISPFNVKKDYEFNVNDDSISELDIKSIEDVMVINTVTLNSNLKKITINLRAPIIINIKSKLGEQIILENDDYLIKQPLFKEE